MNTIEGNRLIAEFDKSDAVNSPHLKRDDELQYHSNWDWLMPIVDKIENTVVKDFGTYVKIDTHECSIFNAGSLNKKDHFKHSEQIPNECRCDSWKANNKIEAAWLCVIYFIQWYNKNKPS